jgi:protein O-mannosyl-transferase
MEWRRPVAVAAALLLLNVFVYGAVLDFDFVNFDDPVYVAQNPRVMAGLTSPGVAWAFTTGTAGNWHPLTWLSHMVDTEIHGAWAGGHHLTNLVFHVASTLLLFSVLLRVTGALGRSAFVAALFAAHPLHVESVAWVSERKDVLSTFLWALTLWAYTAYVRRPGFLRYAAIAVTLALGLMAKPMLVTLPPLLLLLDIWPLRRLDPVATPFDRRTFARLVREKMPLFVLAFAASAVALYTQRAVGTAASFDRLPFGTRAAHALVSYIEYIERMLWPAGLAAFYPYPVSPHSIPTVVACGAVLAGLSYVAFRALRRFPYVFTGWFWFLGTFVPVIGLVQVGNQATADRYTYVPLTGLFIVVAWGIGDLVSRFKVPRFVLPSVALAVVLASAVAAREQTASWRNSETLWRHALEVAPDNYYARGALGPVLAEQGKLAEAIEHMTEALRLRPNQPEVELDLGEVYARQGDLSAATTHFAKAVALDPAFAEAHHNLGVAYANQRRDIDAIAAFKEALRLNPDLPKTRAALANAYARGGSWDDAIHETREWLRLEPERPDALCGLAVLLYQKGEIADARLQVEAALAIDPGHVTARALSKELANLERARRR